MFNLNFDIYSAKDRAQSLQTQDLSSLSPKNLELCANYILYGKDPDNLSAVDKKEVYIKSKFNSYSKKEPVSLDSLLESPTFNENVIQTTQTKYKKAKPTIDKEKAKDVPGMQQLWNEIDKMQRIYDENTGKTEKTNSTPSLDKSQLYYLNHQLIEMRRQQYYLMDSVYPTLQLKPNKATYYPDTVDLQPNFNVLPRGTFSQEHDTLFMNPLLDGAAADFSLDTNNTRAATIDFTNKEHVTQLILFYWDLKLENEHNPDSPLHNLLWTLDFYIEKAHLSPQQQLILKDKKLRMPNKSIAAHLMSELGIYHQENYVSTIWTHTVSLVCEAAALNFDEFQQRNNPKAWKVCSCCGETLLRDARNFVRKAKAADGLTNRCKRCDKVARQKAKEEKQQ